MSSIELSEFIKESLKQIVKGIQTAKGDPDYGRYIAPLLQGSERNSVGNFHVKDDTSRQATVVKFDVEVTTSTEGTGKANAGAKFSILVAKVELGVGGDVRRGALNVNRLQFSVPVEIP